MGLYDQYLFRSPLLEDYNDDEYIDTTPIYYNEEYNCFVDDYGNIYVLDEGWASNLANSIRKSLQSNRTDSQSQRMNNRPLLPNNNQSRIQKIPASEVNRRQSAAAASLLGDNLRMLRKAGITSDQMHDMVRGKTPKELLTTNLRHKLGNDAEEYYKNIQTASSMLPRNNLWKGR